MKNSKLRDGMCILRNDGIQRKSVIQYIMLMFVLIGAMFIAGCNNKASKEDIIVPTPVIEARGEITNEEEKNLVLEDISNKENDSENGLNKDSHQESKQEEIVETMSKENEESNQNTITYTMDVYTKAPNEASTIQIMYPVFSGDDIEWLNEMVLKKVEGFATLDTSVFEPGTGIHIDYKSEVTYLTDKIVSMIFYGYNFVEGAAHPMDYLFPLNVDLVTRKEIKLEDLYEVNEEFKKVFFTKSYFPENPSTSYSEDTYSEILALQTEEYNILDPFEVEGNITFFLKKTGIVLSMSAIHATGSDHLEGELSYKDISKFYKNETNYVNQP